MQKDQTSGVARLARGDHAARNVIAIRTHYMNAELLHLARELAAGNAYDVIFAIDERGGTMDTAEFPKLPLDDTVVATLGLYMQDGPFLWGFGDYIFYLLRTLRPEAPYLWLVENDVLINCDDKRTPFRKLDGVSTHDLLGTFVETAQPDWFWRQSVEGLFADVYSCFFPLIRLSARAADHLLAVRREQSPLYGRTERFRDIALPNDEALVPSALVDAGFSIADVNQVGELYTQDTFGYYTLFNRYAFRRHDDRLYHSVLSGASYAAKVSRHPGIDCRTMLDAVLHDPDLSLAMIDDRFFQRLKAEMLPLADDPAELLAPASIIAAILAQGASAAVLDGIAAALARSAKPHGLAAFKRQQHVYFRGRPGPFPNIARHRPAIQSSTSVWSNHPDVRQDAAGANDGRLDVEFGCHTDVQEDPWWRVDLQVLSLVHGIRIQNRRQFEQRLDGFQIQSSMDDVAWTVVHAEAGDTAAPALIRIDLPEPVLARYLRLLVPGTTVLHIVEFDAYGHRAVD